MVHVVGIGGVETLELGNQQLLFIMCLRLVCGKFQIEIVRPVKVESGKRLRRQLTMLSELCIIFQLPFSSSSSWSPSITDLTVGSMIVHISM